MNDNYSFVKILRILGRINLFVGFVGIVVGITVSDFSICIVSFSVFVSAMILFALALIIEYTQDTNEQSKKICRLLEQNYRKNGDDEELNK